MKKTKLIFAAMIGNALEYYDFTLYGFFAAFLSPLYFPSDDPQTSIIASFGAFAAGFLMRPVGGLIFGHLGDRYGRKYALMISVLLVTLPTLIIGITPLYSQIGLWAPAIVILSRLMQGICTVGEYTGATVLIAEYTERNQPGFACSLLPASSLIGAILATGLGALCFLDVMPTWAWRLPFIAGAGFGLFGFYLRNQIDESPTFQTLAKQHKISKSPALEILNYQKINFLCTMGIGVTALAPFYIISVYISSLTTQLAFSPSQTLFMNSGVLLMWMLFIPLLGYLSDKVGLGKMMSFGAILLMIISLPAFWFLHQGLSLTKILLVQILISFCGAFFVAPMGAFLTTVAFPPSQRYSGMALGMSCGEALFGGTAPLIAAALVALTNTSIAPGFYLMFCGIIGWFAVHSFKSVSDLKNENFPDKNLKDAIMFSRNYKPQSF